MRGRSKWMNVNEKMKIIFISIKLFFLPRHLCAKKHFIEILNEWNAEERGIITEDDFLKQKINFYMKWKEKWDWIEKRKPWNRKIKILN